MNLHTETPFETEVCEYLAEQGWLYAERDAASYDRPLRFVFAAITGKIDVRGFERIKSNEC
jgi:type I restriction enzyme R subunit